MMQEFCFNNEWELLLNIIHFGRHLIECQVDLKTMNLLLSMYKMIHWPYW